MACEGRTRTGGPAADSLSSAFPPLTLPASSFPFLAWRLQTTKQRKLGFCAPLTQPHPCPWVWVTCLAQHPACPGLWRQQGEGGSWEAGRRRGEGWRGFKLGKMPPLDPPALALLGTYLLALSLYHLHARPSPWPSLITSQTLLSAMAELGAPAGMQGALRSHRRSRWSLPTPGQALTRAPGWKHRHGLCLKDPAGAWEGCVLWMEQRKEVSCWPHQGPHL